LSPAGSTIAATWAGSIRISVFGPRDWLTEEYKAAAAKIRTVGSIVSAIVRAQ
jgi:hypothetical protein